MALGKAGPRSRTKAEISGRLGWGKQAGDVEVKKTGQVNIAAPDERGGEKTPDGL